LALSLFARAEPAHMRGHLAIDERTFALSSASPSISLDLITPSVSD
jgi:hypothetical protein